MVGFETFARRGELTGLEWTDINWEDNTISLTKQTQRVGKEAVEVDSCKTESSNRENLSLSQETMRILKLFKEEQDELKVKLGIEWQGSKKIFTNRFGGNAHPEAPYDILKRLERKYGLNENVSFHEGIRHTGISWALQNFDVSEHMNIVKRAGHKNIAITYNIYAHNMNEDSKEIINGFSSKLYNSNPVAQND